MAEKRMFAKSIIDSDQFLDMPATAQLLYFHLGMRADDDGFINNPKSIMRNVRGTDDDMNILIAKKYIIPFQSGVVVIRHWRIHNYIQKDRYKITNCNEEKAMLEYNEKTKEYDFKDCKQIGYSMDTDCKQIGYSMDTRQTTKNIANPSKIKGLDECIQNGYKLDTQIRLDKIRLDKSSSREEENSTTTTINQEVLSLYQDNIHPITPIEAEKLADDIEQYGVKWCLEAIKRAVMRNKRTLGYIEGILHGWATNGYDNGEKPEPPKKEEVKRPKYADEIRAEEEAELQKIIEEMRGEYG
jgi:DnaD/phage-associated family protein